VRRWTVARKSDEVDWKNIQALFLTQISSILHENIMTLYSFRLSTREETIMKNARRDFIRKSSIMMTGSIIAPGLLLGKAPSEVVSTESFTNEGIPLVVTLYEHPNFLGQRRTIVEDTPALGELDFDNKTSSIKIVKGPDHPSISCPTTSQVEEPTVSFFEHPNCQGDILTLKIGCYPNIGRSFNFDGIISSIAFNVPSCELAHIPYIPLIVELFEHPFFGGSRIVIVQSSRDVGAEFGPRFLGISSMKIRPGPNFDETSNPVITLFPRPDFDARISSQSLGVGDYEFLDAFDDEIRSIKFPEWDNARSNCRPTKSPPPRIP
jgi:hypothetical protein